MLRGGRGGDRRGPAGFRAAQYRDGDRHGKFRREHPREQHVAVVLVVLVLVGFVHAVGDLRVGAGHLRRVMMSGARAAEQEGWFTTTVRPAGPLDHAALARLSETLGALEPSSDMVVVDLTAADVRDPRGLARHLLAPARRFDQAGRCMLVVGASPGLKAELGRAAVPVVTLASEVLHGTAA